MRLRGEIHSWTPLSSRYRKSAVPFYGPKPLKKALTKPLTKPLK